MNAAAKLDFARIEHLLNPAEMRPLRVTIVGLGSGGAPVCDHLTMNGIGHWDLYDPDVLNAENLVKHPRQRRDLGRPKVEIQREWILDRNPQAQVRTWMEDVFESSAFEASVAGSDLVLSCPDTKSAREYISDVCVAQHKPFVTASVFRTGIGGEVYAYLPAETGCYRCLQIFSLLNGVDLTDEALGLGEEEQRRIYGLNESEYRASGLSMDIQSIALIQARMALSILLRGSGSPLGRLKSNWVIFGNRPARGIFKNHFDNRQMLLKPQSACNCQPNHSPIEASYGSIPADAPNHAV